MTREDITRMAREAGLETHERKGRVRIGSAVFTGGDSTESMMSFAALVAEHERAAEREACARMADSMRPNGGRAWDDAQRACFSALTDLAESIRARGSK